MIVNKQQISAIIGAGEQFSFDGFVVSAMSAHKR